MIPYQLYILAFNVTEVLLGCLQCEQVRTETNGVWWLWRWMYSRLRWQMSAKSQRKVDWNLSKTPKDVSARRKRFQWNVTVRTTLPWVVHSSNIFIYNCEMSQIQLIKPPWQKHGFYAVALSFCSSVHSFFVCRMKHVLLLVTVHGSSDAWPPGQCMSQMFLPLWKTFPVKLMLAPVKAPHLFA